MQWHEYYNHLKTLPEDQKEETLNNQLAWLGKQSLYVLAKYFLGYSEINHKTHDPVIECLEGPDPRKLLCLPRGVFKSSLASISYPIWRLIKDPNLRILIDSEVYTNSATFLREIKGHLLDNFITSMYGTFQTGTTWNESEINIKQRTRLRKEANITCSGIGAEKTGQHYDIIIIDDLNSPKNTGTPELRKKAIDHYKSLNSILEPDGELVIIGTRYAEDDLIGHVLRSIFGEAQAIDIEVNGT